MVDIITKIIIITKIVIIIKIVTSITVMKVISNMILTSGSHLVELNNRTRTMNRCTVEMIQSDFCKANPMAKNPSIKYQRNLDNNALNKQHLPLDNVNRNNNWDNNSPNKHRPVLFALGHTIWPRS